MTLVIEKDDSLTALDIEFIHVENIGSDENPKTIIYYKYINGEAPLLNTIFDKPYTDKFVAEDVPNLKYVSVMHAEKKYFMWSRPHGNTAIENNECVIVKGFKSLYHWIRGE